MTATRTGQHRTEASTDLACRHCGSQIYMDYGGWVHVDADHACPARFGTNAEPAALPGTDKEN